MKESFTANLQSFDRLLVFGQFFLLLLLSCAFRFLSRGGRIVEDSPPGEMLGKQHEPSRLSRPLPCAVVSEVRHRTRPKVRTRSSEKVVTRPLAHE